MQRLVGQSLDRYRLEVLLGEGGMGAVFRASDITLQRQVAVKVMHPHIARQPQFRDRFLQEARTAARLDHPGIVKVFDFGQDAGHLFIVMEFIPGENLRAMLKRLAPAGQPGSSPGLVLSEAVQLVRQVCLALEYAHKNGVLHRDLKPDNIMLKPASSVGEVDGELPYQPVLTDLGLAKLAGGGLMTAAGMSMGTPAYMSPEQAVGQRTDARSDVYSLGILLFELAVGRLPFPARTVSEAIRYHTQQQPPPPRSLRPDLPERLEAVIMQALAKNPDGRFRGAGALAKALGAVQPQVRSTARVEGASSLTHVISLATPMERDRPESRGPSIFEQFPSQPASLAQDRVVALLADGSLGRATLRPEGLTIGRGTGNDLVIDDGDVSRQHARVTSSAEVYQVTDLDSTNGTYLGDVRLLPGVPQRWDPDVPLRMGRTWLRLELAGRQEVRQPQPAPGLTGAGRPSQTWDYEEETIPDAAAYRADQVTFPEPLPDLGATLGAGTIAGDDGKRRRTRFPVWALVAAIVVILGLAATGIYFLSTGRQDEPTVMPTHVVQVTDTPTSVSTAVPPVTPGDQWTEVPTAEETAVPPTTLPSDVPTQVPEPVTPAPSDTPTASATITDSPTPTASSTPTATATATSTPSVTPTPTCAQPVDAQLLSSWDRSKLGCAVAPADVIWAAWEPFEKGYMLWRIDTDQAYAFFFQNETNSTRGSYQAGPNAWKWDGSYPDGIGLTPPPGLLEPVRGFGFVWRNFLGGPPSQIGWATEEEKGFCARIQPFEQGFMFHSDTVVYCEDEYYNWATHPSFVVLYFSLYSDGAWRRH